MENTAPETKQLSTWQWAVLISLPIVLALIQRATIPPILERLGLPSRYIDFIPLDILFELGFMLYLGKKLTGSLYSQAVLVVMARGDFDVLLRARLGLRAGQHAKDKDDERCSIGLCIW
jgi:hypothetical protein